jgi:PPOX class probable F420-dependent enzyme
MARSIATNTSVGLAELLDFVRMLLATTRRDGRPQISPVSGGVDPQDRIVISTYPARAKTRNAERNPKVTVLVLSDDWNGPWVQVDGDADVLHMPEALDSLVEYFRSIRRAPRLGRVPGGHAHPEQVPDPDHPDPVGSHRHRWVPGRHRRPTRRLIILASRPG